MGALALESVIRSDIGRRSNNEDAAFASARLAAVADGVGGEVAGEVASRSIINALIKLDKCWLEGHLADAMRDAVNWGNQTLELVTECEPDLSGMSTTLTAVALDDDGLYVVANVGDSRTYLFRDDELSLLTHDDSLVQVLVDRGRPHRRRGPRASVPFGRSGGARRAPAIRASAHRTEGLRGGPAAALLRRTLRRRR
jgi:PPM family protein phosphatase